MSRPGARHVSSQAQDMARWTSGANWRLTRPPIHTSSQALLVRLDCSRSRRKGGFRQASFRDPPIENSCGFGSGCGHWRRASLKDVWFLGVASSGWSQGGWIGAQNARVGHWPTVVNDMGCQWPMLYAPWPYFQGGQGQDPMAHAVRLW